MRQYLTTDAADDWANPSAEHDVGYAARVKMNSDREAIADTLGVNAGEIIFTSGATESINTVLHPEHCRQLAVHSVISSALEHSATKGSLDRLKRHGVAVHLVRCTPTGGLDYEHLAEICQANPRSLVSLMHANNETGVINDATRISGIARSSDGLIHLDAVQTLGKLALDFGAIDFDWASFTGHKLGSLKGIGLLVTRQPKVTMPLLIGGSQEGGKRGGTSNVMSVRSLRLALDDAAAWDIGEITRARDELFAAWQKQHPTIELNCEAEPRLCNTLSIYIPGASAKELMLKASRAGVMISTGSACTAGNERPSYVIEGIYGTERARGTVRVSAGASAIRCPPILGGWASN